MQYYQCKCGKNKAWGSMSPPICAECDECRTALEWHPYVTEYKKAEPHKFFEDTVDTDDGMKKLTMCVYCGRTKKEIEKL